MKSSLISGLLIFLAIHFFALDAGATAFGLKAFFVGGVRARAACHELVDTDTDFGTGVLTATATLDHPPGPGPYPLPIECVSVTAEVSGAFDIDLEVEADHHGFGGHEDPFVDPIVPLIGPGMASLDVHGEFTDSTTFEVSGSGYRNFNGYLELGIIVAPSALSLTEVEDIFTTIDAVGSLEKALAMDPSFLSGYSVDVHREDILEGAFSFAITGGLTAGEEDRIILTGVSHAVSATVPEPSAIATATCGLILVCSAARKFAPSD